MNTLYTRNNAVFSHTVTPLAVSPFNTTMIPHSLLLMTAGLLCMQYVLSNRSIRFQHRVLCRATWLSVTWREGACMFQLLIHLLTSLPPPYPSRPLLVYIMIRSIAGPSGLALSARCASHLVVLYCTCPVYIQLWPVP